MKTNLNQKSITPGVKSAVNAYLLARVYAETMRNTVNQIEVEILKEAPLSNGFDRVDMKEITDPEQSYLCTDENQLKDYYAECDSRERKAGLKPNNMPFDHCPALVAEHIQVQTEWLICENAAEMLGLEFEGKELNNRLLCLGLEKRQKFIDLVVGLVVNLPDFKSPLANATK